MGAQKEAVARTTHPRYTARMNTPLSSASIAGMIDHALLSPTLSASDFDRGIETALRLHTASVCIMPWYVAPCARALAGSGVRTCTVIGFPHGGHTTATKVREAEIALDDGAEELDMVINISAARSGRWDLVGDEIRRVVETGHARGAKVKVILETCHLSPQQIGLACEAGARAGADWMKTSTGFGPYGARDEDLAVMRRHTPASIPLKASGGIRTFARVQELLGLGLGITRLGCSASEAIVAEACAALGE